MEQLKDRPAFRALLVWPRFPSSFWSFQGVMEMIRCKAVMPPLGLLTVAALCPDSWELRLVDQAVEDLADDDILWADLVMVGAMAVQRDAAKEVLERCRRLGRRTVLGGPWASSEPEVALEVADHVVTGEPDEVFADIARELEAGTARHHYDIQDKPDVTQTPCPRFDLLNLEAYASMPVQFSRGCPFECEFCDIIILYGRKPRTKSPEQLQAELQTLYDLGWRKEVFVVDDNFIGNRKKALDLCRSLVVWQGERDFPFAFYTEASLDLAERQELLDTMVEANFFYVFVGIESPSAASLAETKKHQNLRQKPLHSIQALRSRGLWVTGGFIVGFDSDGEEIFDSQQELIGEGAIPWAMLGLLQAPPGTPLAARMKREGRLIENSDATHNFALPNFQTRLPLVTLLEGYRDTLAQLYSPEAYYDRAFRSLWHWKPRRNQKPPNFSLAERAQVFLSSLWQQGVRSSYRGAYWRFLLRLLYHWGARPQKVWLGFTLLIAGHHFILYAEEVAAGLEAQLRALEGEESSEEAAKAPSAA